jgi:hypothetical protein
MASGIYNRAKFNLMAGLMDLNDTGADTIKCALLTDSHSFDADNNTWSQISANEASGVVYVAGGQALTNPTVTQNGTPDNNAVFDADNVTWASETITAAFAVLYDDTLPGKDLICCFDFGGNKSSSNGDFVISFDADGIIELS